MLRILSNMLRILSNMLRNLSIGSKLCRICSNSSFQKFWIKLLQLRYNETTIFSNEFAVKINFSPTVFLPLNNDHVPMDGGIIAVICIFIRLTWCKVKTSIDFFIE